MATIIPMAATAAEASCQRNILKTGHKSPTSTFPLQTKHPQKVLISDIIKNIRRMINYLLEGLRTYMPWLDWSPRVKAYDDAEIFPLKGLQRLMKIGVVLLLAIRWNRICHFNFCSSFRLVCWFWALRQLWSSELNWNWSLTVFLQITDWWALGARLRPKLDFWTEWYTRIFPPWHMLSSIGPTCRWK